MSGPSLTQQAGAPVCLVAAGGGPCGRLVVDRHASTGQGRHSCFMPLALRKCQLESCESFVSSKPEKGTCLTGSMRLFKILSSQSQYFIRCRNGLGDNENPKTKHVQLCAVHCTYCLFIKQVTLGIVAVGLHVHVHCCSSAVHPCWRCKCPEKAWHARRD